MDLAQDVLILDTLKAFIGQGRLVRLEILWRLFGQAIQLRIPPLVSSIETVTLFPVEPAEQVIPYYGGVSASLAVRQIQSLPMCELFRRAEPRR